MRSFPEARCARKRLVAATERALAAAAADDAQMTEVQRALAGHAEQLLQSVRKLIDRIVAALAEAGPGAAPLLDAAAEAAEVAELQRLEALEVAATAEAGGAPPPVAPGGPLASVADDSWARELQASVLNCEGLPDAEVYRATLEHLASTGGSLPSLPQVAWVTPATSAAAVDALVRRAAAFHELPFALIGVNRLTVPAREELMRALARPSGRRANLALVFCDATGQASLSLVSQRRNVAPGSALPASRVAKLVGGTLERGGADALFSDVTLVAGEAGSGKTRWIGGELRRRAGPHSLTVAVHRTIDVDGLADEYARVVEEALRAAAPPAPPDAAAEEDAAPAAAAPGGAAAAPPPPAADPRPEIALFFNVSASAVAEPPQRGSGGGSARLTALRGSGGSAPAAQALHGLLTQVGAQARLWCAYSRHVPRLSVLASTGSPDARCQRRGPRARRPRAPRRLRRASRARRLAGSGAGRRRL